MDSRERAARLADDLLFPAALDVDRAEGIPSSHFAALAAQGLYDFDGDLGVVEALAGGCLATAFVWLQHLGPLMSAVHTPHLKDEWAGPLARGEIRGGIALAGARPGTQNLKAVSTSDGFRLDGTVPWVTGWDMIDVIEVAAVDGDELRFLLVHAVESPTLAARVNHLVAANASRTATLTFTGHHVPAGRFVRSMSLRDWQDSQVTGSALNGGLALGVASRCLHILDQEDQDEGIRDHLRSELDNCRDILTKDTGIPAARAAASELAMRAAATLMVQTGSRSVLLDNHAQRLAREAAFLLVFGSRPLIRDELLWRVSRTIPAPPQNISSDGSDLR